MQRSRQATLLLCLFATVLWADASSGQNAFYYPSRGQSQQQQQQDRQECHTWAVQQVGFDPTRAPPPGQAVAPPPPSAQAPQGGLVRGAARGAAVGAVGGAIGGDAGK